MTKPTSIAMTLAGRRGVADFTPIPLCPELDLDCPPIVPLWPRPSTVAELALEMLLNCPLNPDQFQARCGSQRLAACVCELRDLGWPIDTHDKAAPTPEIPLRRIALYVLNLQKVDLSKVVRP